MNWAESNSNLVTVYVDRSVMLVRNENLRIDRGVW